MAYAVHITGLAKVQRMLGADYRSAIQAATQAIALEVQGNIAPYPPATEANSPGNPTGRWYERGYGPKRLRKDGTIWGRKTSQMLNRQWGIKRLGSSIGHYVFNRATYAKFVHGAADQPMIFGRRGWVTDKAAVQNVIQSGVVKRIVVAAMVGAIRRR